MTSCRQPGELHSSTSFLSVLADGHPQRPCAHRANKGVCRPRPLGCHSAVGLLPPTLVARNFLHSAFSSFFSGLKNTSPKRCQGISQRAVTPSHICRDGNLSDQQPRSDDETNNRRCRFSSKPRSRNRPKRGDRCSPIRMPRIMNAPSPA